MKTISQEDLKGRERSGAKVRQPAAQPPVPKPKKQIESASDTPASMRGSMKFLEQQAEATRIVTAMNAEVIADFKDTMQTLVGELQARTTPVIAEPGALPEYTFDLVRDKDSLLKRVYARPGIQE